MSSLARPLVAAACAAALCIAAAPASSAAVGASSKQPLPAFAMLNLAPYSPAPTKAPTLAASTYSTLTVNITAITSLPAGTEPLTGYQVRFTPVNSSFGSPLVVRTSTSDLKVTAGLLQTGVAYNVDYAGVNIVDGSEVVGPFGPNLTATPLGAPAPENVRVVSEGNHLVSLDWSDVADATKYTVYYKPVDGSAAEKPVNTAAATADLPAPSTLKVTGLDNGKEYTFEVAATTLVNGSSKVGDRSAFVSASPISPAVPADLHVTGIGNARAYLDWAPVSGAESYYLKAEVMDANGIASPAVPSPVRVLTTATATTKTIAGLTNGVDYRIRIATTKDGVAGNYSSDASSTRATPSAVPGISTPTKVAVTPTSISVKWSAPTAVTGVDAADRYKVTYTPSNGAAPIVNEVATLSDTASGLITGVTYSIVVQAGNTAGWGMKSGTPLVLVASDKPGAVRTPTVARSGDGTAATVAWDTPDYTGGTTIKSYTVTPKQVNPAGTAPAAKSGITANSWEFTGLNPDADYTFTITANTDSGAGASVSTGSLASRPTMTSDATYDYSEQTVTISWDKVANTKLSYQAQAVQIPRGQQSTTIVTPATQTCDTTSCTAVFTKFADNINGEAWAFKVRTTDNVYSTSNWVTAQTAPVGNASTLVVSQATPAAQCPAGTVQVGSSTCRESLPYTYHTEDRYVECAGADCPGSSYIITPQPCSVGTAHGDTCQYWSVGHKWITVVITDNPPSGFTDNGTEYVKDSPLVEFNDYAVKSTFPWTTPGRQANGVVYMLVNGNSVPGLSPSLGRCPGSVQVALTGLSGSSTKNFNICN